MPIPAYAQASRTWVSGVGDDANPCSRTAPCKTFAGAISKTAVNGEINCLDPGGFGAVTITKSITIDCHEVFASILHSGTNGINIPFDSFAGTDTRKTVNLRNINPPGLVTRGLIGLRIFGAGTGSFVNIEDCLCQRQFRRARRRHRRSAHHRDAEHREHHSPRHGGRRHYVIASAGARPIKATLSNLRVINAANGVAGRCRRGRSSQQFARVKQCRIGRIAISGGRINVDGTTITFSGIGINRVGGSVNLSNNDISFNTVGVSGAVSSNTNNRCSITVRAERSRPSAA